MSLKELNHINWKYKSIVIGWMKQQTREYELSNIPSLITGICILFYYIKEKFSQCGDCGEIMTQINERDTFKHHNLDLSDDCSVFGTININTNNFRIMRWTFHITNLHSCISYMISGVRIAQDMSRSKIALGIANRWDSYLNEHFVADLKPYAGSQI